MSSQEKWRRLPSGLGVSPDFQKTLESMGISDNSADELQSIQKTEEIKKLPNDFIEYDTLYIGGDSDMHHLFETFFGIHGLTFQGFYSGERGLKKLKQYIPYLIFIDTMLPGIKGPEICKIIQAKQKWQQIPIIFISTQIDYYIEKFRSCADGCLWIPFDFKAIKLLILFVKKLQKIRSLKL